MAGPFAFQIHHIFPKELFDDPRIAEQLASLIAGSNFTTDMAGNEIALFSDPSTLTMYRHSQAWMEAISTTKVASAVPFTAAAIPDTQNF